MKTPKPPKSNPKKTSIKKPLTKKQKITLIIWVFIMTALALFLWLSPPIPDPDRKRFTTLYEDMKYATEQTNDMVEWSEIERQCSYSKPTNVNLKGGWDCTVSAHNAADHSTDIFPLAKRIEDTGRFTIISQSEEYGVVSLRHTRSSIRCSLSDRLYDRTLTPVAFYCSDAAKKPWFPPASNSTDDSLPGAGAWKRPDYK